MAQLIVDNIWAHFKADSIDKSVLKAIEERMSYKISEYNRWRRTYIDFDKSLYERGDQKFPTGLYSLFDEVAKSFELDYEIIDLRVKPEVGNTLTLYEKTLREYQEEIVYDAVKNERGVIKVATGGGKTVIAAAIIAKLNVKTIFIVNSLDLLEQTHDEFTKMLKIDIGKIGGGYCDIQKINICTIQTLHSALGLKYAAVDEDCYIEEKIATKVLERKGEIKKLIETCEMVINDECHHSAANSYVNMMKHAKRAHWKFACSGTPYRLESTDILLDAFSGKLIANVTASFLIERGFLVAPKIYFLDPNELGKYKYIRDTSFHKIYQKWIVENNNRNKLISDCANRLLELNKTVLITVTRIEHGQRIMDLLYERIPGIKAAFIKGEVHKDERKRLLNEIREKKLNVLVGTSVADEGLDLPALDSAIMGGGGKSLIKSLQRVGRTLRPYPDAEHNIKKEAIIIDFWDHLRYLTGQSVKRMKIYSSEHLFQVLKHF